MQVDQVIHTSSDMVELNHVSETAKISIKKYLLSKSMYVVNHFYNSLHPFGF